MSHVCVVDIGYGDAGKGAVVDRLCAQGDVGLVVRWNGGCQAQHNVIQNDGRHHTFSQFGSGSFHDVPTYLAAPVMVEPMSMLNEGLALEKTLGRSPWPLMFVDVDCRVTTPYHWLVNRWQEDQRGDGRHGSCGRGIGMTAKYALDNPEDAVYVRDVDHFPTLQRKLYLLEDWARIATNNEVEDDLPDVNGLMYMYDRWRKHVAVYTQSMAERLAMGKRIVFEGAQGVLLDENWGWHPHTTWSTVTPNYPREWFPDVHVIGVTRAYTTRHGAGPFVAEDATLNLPELHNRREHFQGVWRVGHFDFPAIQYAARATQVDSIYVTHLDSVYLENRVKVCTAYEVDGVRVQPLPLLSWNYARREEQTALLLRATPVLEDRPYSSWSESIAHLLELPVTGIAMGARTGAGVFLDWSTV